MDGISDVIIQSTSGIPYIARCYDSEFCQKYPNHMLLTGFFAAMNSFSGEFQQDKLTIVGFDELTLVFERREDILVIFGLENIKNNEYDPSIRDVANEICDQFLTRYQT
ncbi:MAG: hypothetical protein ACXAD7_01855, partial [Candidatus Kariarchaeaceae archaeon]